MDITNIANKTALVLETNNLRGGNDRRLMVQSLMRVIGKLKQQTVPLTWLAQMVVTHDGLNANERRQIRELSECPIDFVEITADTGYYQAKNIGFERTDANRCEWIVFADSDCIPVDDWLEQLLQPFTVDQRVDVVAGRTSYASNLFGTALTTIDFMYFPNNLGATVGWDTTSNFYANNVVFRRGVFDRYRYQAHQGFYRGHCQVLGLRLFTEKVPLVFAPKAHTQHRLPDSKRETVKLRWYRGQDSVALTPHLVRTHLSKRWQWLARSGPIGPLCVMATRLFFSLRSINRQYLPKVTGVRWLATVVLVVGLSALDSLGALARGIGIRTQGKTNRDAHALSYHGK